MLKPAVSCIAAAGLSISPVIASESPTDTNANASRPILLEEIVVTATKREQELAEVPLSAQVFSGAQLVQQNLPSLEALGQVVPSVGIAGTFGRSGGLFIRGVGSGAGTAFDQSVGNFTDDIYHGRTQYLFGQFLDVQRVELLKGPQSTFFGNDAIAGAINITTAKPNEDFEASARGLYGMAGQYEAEGMVNMPIDEHWQVRTAILANGEDGWLDNVGNEKFPHQNNLTGRISTRFRNDDWDAILKIEGAQVKDGGGLFLTVADCPPPAPYVAAGFCKSVDQGVPQGLVNKTAEVPGQKVDLSTQEEVLTLNYHRWDHTFTSVTGYSAYHYQQNLDVAGTPVNTIDVSTPEHYNQLSQELRVASPLGNRVEYLGGIYAQTDELVNDTDAVYYILNAAIPAANQPLGQDVNYRQHEHLYSAFASITGHATDALSFTAGLRATQVNKSYSWHLFYGTALSQYGNVSEVPGLSAVPVAFGLGNPGILAGHRSDHAVTPSFSTQYKLTDTSMLYASYTRGFKSGGFNAGDHSANPAQVPYGPEHVNAFEVGSKNKWGNFQLDTDVFYSRYDNLQVTFNRPEGAGAFVNLVANAAVVVSKGVELDGKWAIGPHWRLGLDATYMESDYVSYPNANPSVLQVFQGQTVANLAGTPTQSAPRWSGTLTGTYLTTLPGDYHLEASVYEIGSSDFFSNILDHQDGAYFRLDNLLSLESPSHAWSFDVIGHNLTDRNIIIFQTNQSTAPGTILNQKEQPRSVAVQIRRRW